ncbi:hypothetical protein F5X96DRAFT_630373 [Biscogniauxia mediterranea]|nr:hypothetical protein F5X96DRAFT_630373 [Biscogniauxia mediterranea]
MTSSLQQPMPKRESPLAFMEKLSPAVLFHRPSASISPSPTTDPKLVLVLGWMDARDVHLARYVNQYRTMYPSSAILLVKGRLADLIFPSIGLRDTAPAVEPILATLTERDNGTGPQDTRRPQLLIHSLSGGGSCSLYHLYNHFSQRHSLESDVEGHGDGDREGKPSLPKHVTIFDSSPGVWSYQFNVDLLTAGLKPGWKQMVALPVAHLVAMTFWVLIRVFGLPDNQKTYSTAHNDPRKNDEFSRIYIYSNTDKICPAKEVELDAAEAKKKGFNVRLERFEGSGHVGHIRVDAERYWSIVKEAWDDTSKL